MFAIVRTGGKQYRVRLGDRIAVELLDVEEGAELALDDVLLVGDDANEGGVNTTVGSPTVAGAVVRVRVESHDRAAKVTSFHYKNKTRQKTMRGHRQHQTRLVIMDISAG